MRLALAGAAAARISEAVISVRTLLPRRNAHSDLELLLLLKHSRPGKAAISLLLRLFLLDRGEFRVLLLGGSSD